jgi:Fe2+ or Zn2+ uptake regulation protein
MSEKRIEVEILSYLVEHPSASDTLEGIIEWWLLEQKIKTGIRTVQAALEKLREMGFVTVRKKTGRAKTYCVNTEKLAEIRLWLASQTTE